MSVLLSLDLTGEGLAAPFDAVLDSCDPDSGGSSASPRITIPRLLDVTGPTIISTNWTAGSTNFGDAVNYYIVENDERYNVVWRGGIHVTSVVDDDCAGSGTKTYTISTESDLAGPNGVELWTRAAKGKPRMVPFDPSDPSVVAHLELGKIYYMIGKLDRAREHLQPLLSRGEADRVARQAREVLDKIKSGA